MENNNFEIPKEYLGNKRDDGQYIENDSAGMLTAMVWALRSKDPSTQVGACFINERGRIISVGYNGTPNGWKDEEFPYDKPKDIKYNKYTYVVHAEMNALFNNDGVNVGDFRDSTLYVTFLPCTNCAKNLIQAGVKRVVYLHDNRLDPEGRFATMYMFNKCGVELVQFDKLNIENLKEVLLDIEGENEKNFSNIKKLGLKNNKNNDNSK